MNLHPDPFLLHPESMKVDLPSTLCWARLARVDLFTREGSLAISRPITKLPNPSSGPIGTPTVVSVKTLRLDARWLSAKVSKPCRRLKILATNPSLKPWHPAKVHLRDLRGSERFHGPRVVF
jgi:hypothetical protein